MSKTNEFFEWTEKQAPPGPPPRPGLQWKESTKRWIRPRRNVAQERYVKEIQDYGEKYPKRWTCPSCRRSYVSERGKAPVLCPGCAHNTRKMSDDLDFKL